MSVKQKIEVIDAFMNYIDERLNQWAAWYRQRVRLGIGYPPCSIEYRMMTEGCIPRSEYLSLRPMPTNELAEEIEACMVELSKQYKDAAEAVRKHYYEKGSAKQKSRAMQINESHFERLIVFARAWLLGRLTPTGKLVSVMRLLEQIEYQATAKKS